MLHHGRVWPKDNETWYNVLHKAHVDKGGKAPSWGDIFYHGIHGLRLQDRD